MLRIWMGPKLYHSVKGYQPKPSESYQYCMKKGCNKGMEPDWLVCTESTP